MKRRCVPRNAQHAKMFFGSIFDAVVVADGECREFVAKHEQPFAWAEGGCRRRASYVDVFMVRVQRKHRRSPTDSS